MLALLAGAAAVLGLTLSFVRARLAASVAAASVARAKAKGDRCEPAKRPLVVAKLREAVANGSLELSTDPRSPHYDPVKLARLEKNAFDLYESEPRAEEWARAVETAVRPLVDERLKEVPGGKVVAIDCKTSSCAVTVEAPKESEIELQYEIQAVAFGQHEVFRVEKTAPETFRFTTVSLIDAEHHDPKVYADWLRRIQAKAESRKPGRDAAIKAQRRAREQASLQRK